MDGVSGKTYWILFVQRGPQMEFHLPPLYWVGSEISETDLSKLEQIKPK